MESLPRLDSSLSLSNEARASPPTPSPNTFDIVPFRIYLSQLIPLVLGAQADELQDMFTLPDFQERAARWAGDPSAGVVYVVKTREMDDDDVVQGQDAGAPGESSLFLCCRDSISKLGLSRADESTPAEINSYHLTSTLTYSPNQAATLALIKHVPTLDTTLPLSSQLHFLNLFGPASTVSPSSSGALATTGSSSATSAATNGSQVYEGLHRLVHWGVAPAFEAFVESRNKIDAANGAAVVGRRRGDEGKEADGKMGIPMTKKKFAELELSLLHCESFLSFETAGGEPKLIL